MICNPLPHGTILTIIHNDLEKNKVNMRWVPKILTDNYEVNRLSATAQFLALHNAEGEDLFDRVVTGDEKWVHHFIPTSSPMKVDSKQWVDKGGQAPRTAKRDQFGRST